MSLSFKLHLLSCLLILELSTKSKALRLSDNSDIEQLISPALTICKRTAKLSGRALFYVISLNSEFPIHKLIQKLHENMIDTVLITHHTLLQQSIVGSWTKNIILFLNNLDEIINSF